MHFKYRGYNDTYSFNRNDEVPEYSSERLRFGTLSPYSFVYNLNETNDTYCYNIAGPMYSLVKEIALSANLRFELQINSTICKIISQF